MTPPLCVVCMKAPVAPVPPTNRTQPALGWRVVDGVRWNWTCSTSASRGCQARLASARVDRSRLHHGHRAWRHQQFEKRLAAAQAQLRTYADEHGRVSIEMAARVLVECERLAEHRGGS